MRSLQQQKQLELNLGPVAEMPPSHRFEEFIAGSWGRTTLSH